MAFSPDGTRVVTASDDNYAFVWDAATGRPLTPPLIHIGSVHQVCFSPDGKRLATAAFVPRIYELSSGTPPVPILKHDGPIWRVSFSPDGDRAADRQRADGTARVWEARTGKELAVLRGHTQAVFDAAFSPDGRRIVTASRRLHRPGLGRRHVSPDRDPARATPHRCAASRSVPTVAD